MGDFNETRKKYNNRDGQKLYIMAPVLQVKEGTKYRNVLSLADGDKNNGFYISNDQNQDLITIPPYCNGERKPQTRMASNARNKEAAR